MMNPGAVAGRAVALRKNLMLEHSHDLEPARASTVAAEIALPASRPPVTAGPGSAVSDTALWQTTADSLQAHVAVLDERGVIVAVNRAWRAFSAQEGHGEDWVGTDYLRVCDASGDADAREVAAALREMLAGRRDYLEREYACHSPSERRWFVLRGWRHDGLCGRRLLLLHEPVTLLRLAEQQLRMQATLLDQTSAAVILADSDLTIVDCNGGVEALYGYRRDEIVGSPVQMILGPGERPVSRRRADRGPVRVRRRARRKDGSQFTAEVRVCRIDREDARPLYASVSFDVTQQEAAQQALVRSRGYLSAITENIGDGLYTLDAAGKVMYMNHAAQEMLGWTLSELQGVPAHLAIHHHACPEEVARGGGCAILQAVRDHQVVRVEDDLFMRNDGEALPVRYTAAPFETEDGTVGCVVVFQDITARKAEARRLEGELEKLTWLNRLQEALRDGRFLLFAQPIIDLRTGAVVQRELLLRMRSSAGDDVGAILAPGRFLPIAEEYGLITDIDRWVVDQAAQIAAGGTMVELNVSARSVTDPAFPDHVRDALLRTGAPAAALVFEITETALISDETAARRFVECLHGLGCGIALDDFGTGYGGFTYLKQLPIDSLKIDIEFVRDLTTNAGSRNVVEAVVGLARGFGLKTVAEGVEDAETQVLLRELGVDFAQGFHIGRPAPL